MAEREQTLSKLQVRRAERALWWADTFAPGSMILAALSGMIGCTAAAATGNGVLGFLSAMTVLMCPLVGALLYLVLGLAEIAIAKAKN